MLDALLWALVAALILSIASLMFKRPRTILAGWSRKLVRRVQLRLYLEHRETTQRAIERIAAYLAQRRNSEEGNPDDEFYSDLYRWFSGDPDANVDYSRKQQRDRDQLRRDF